MKRRLYTLYILLSVTLTLVAQPRISSNKEIHHFGQVEWKQPVTVEYTITNTGDQPLVMTQVSPSCACSSVDWTKTPIAAGEKGVVKATFDSEALGRFEKSLGIYSNAIPHLVYLKFSGEVVREIKDFTHALPYAIGPIQLDRMDFAFPDVYRGESPQITFSIANLSDRAYIPILMHLPSYLKMEKHPEVLQKGQKGTITLTLDTKHLADFGLTQASVYLSRFIGDKVGEENEIPVSVVMLPDFSEMSEHEKQNAPGIRLSETEIDLSAPLEKKKSASHDVHIFNTGKSALQINKLQVLNASVGVSLKKSLLQPGEYTRLRVTISKRNVGNKKHPSRILLITNDPAHPKVEINVKR